MADNLLLNAASVTGGATLAADDISSVWYQRVKLTDGTADSSTAIAAGGGVEANALRVTIANDSTGQVTIDGTVTANLSATDNAVLDQLEVNTSYGDQTGGGAEASALRVTIANDSTGVLTVDDGGSSITVDGTVTANLSATDNAVLDNIDTNTSAGTSHYRNIDANAEVEIKGSAGTLFWVHVMNMTAAVAYLHLYDATAASVTPGTTTPNFTFALPTQGDTNGAGFTLSLGANGQAFANAITLVCTTTLDGSAGDPGTNGVIVNAGYT